MVDEQVAGPVTLAHGALDLPKLRVDDYNIELRSGEGFAGDRASKRAFAEILEEWRARLRKLDADPFGDTPTEAISRKKLDKVLEAGEPEAAGLVQSAIEEFAEQLAAVIRRFLRLKQWRETERFVIGGGMRGSRIGELAIGRAAVLLKSRGIDVELAPIRHDPEEAGLIGAVHLIPGWIIAGHDGILAADVGGTNIRAGVVELPRKRNGDLAKASVWRAERWRHAGEKVSRDEAVDRLIGMLRALARRAEKAELNLAPFIGLGCPGIIAADGTIERGGQNLPGGHWESKGFSLPQRIKDGLPRIGEHETTVLLHNDAVVQGLSDLPFMQDARRWGVLTIGTGLGNARFTNKEEPRGN